MAAAPRFGQHVGELTSSDVLRLIRHHGASAPEYLTAALRQHERMVEGAQDQLLQQADSSPQRLGVPIGALRQTIGAALIQAGTRLAGGWSPTCETTTRRWESAPITALGQDVTFTNLASGKQIT